MSEVTWFKVLTDIFSDDKIKIIQSMPEGDALLVMWFKVLSQAGKTNDGGYIYLKKNIPYTAGMLSTLFGKQQQLVELAMRTFTEFGMIDIDENGYIFVTHWERHQSIDRLNQLKEKTNLRVQKHREKKKLELMECNVTETLLKRPINAVDLELDLDKEKDTTTTENPSLSALCRMIFGFNIVPPLITNYLVELQGKGYTDSFLRELLLETGESAKGVATLRLLMTIGDRWEKDKIYSRQQAKQEKEKAATVSAKPYYIQSDKDAELQQRLANERKTAEPQTYQPDFNTA